MAKIGEKRDNVWWAWSRSLEVEQLEADAEDPGGCMLEMPITLANVFFMLKMASRSQLPARDVVWGLGSALRGD